MTKVVGVRFRTGARVYSFDPLDFTFAEGDGVIVETARGLEYGEVAQTVRDASESELVAPLKPVIRPASEQDKASRAENMAKEPGAFELCTKKIEQHGLDMKLVDVEYSFNGSKVVFYFTADERVDFRELVKDLASQFRTRIELRQIGVRDEAKMLGGLGSCGRPVCCKAFLDDFRPVSIKMAKEQNLSLSPTKISGLCGRLMCCLQYEQSAYEDMKKRMPRTGREVLTPDGVGIAVENNAITEKTKVRLTMPDGTVEVRSYHYSRLAKPGEPLPVSEEPSPAAPAPEKVAIGVPVGAYTPPETAGAVSTPAAAEDTAAKRRRRGGRGRGGRAPDGQASQQGTARPTPRPNQQRPAGDSQKMTPEPQKAPIERPKRIADQQQTGDTAGSAKSGDSRRRRYRGNRGHGGAGNSSASGQQGQQSAPSPTKPAE